MCGLVRRRGEKRTGPNARARGIKDTQRNEQQQERPRGQERDEGKRRSGTIALGGSKIRKRVITAASLERCSNLTTSGRAAAVLGAPRPAFLGQGRLKARQRRSRVRLVPSFNGAFNFHSRPNPVVSLRSPELPLLLWTSVERAAPPSPISRAEKCGSTPRTIINRLRRTRAVCVLSAHLSPLLSAHFFFFSLSPSLRGFPLFRRPAGKRDFLPALF